MGYHKISKLEDPGLRYMTFLQVYISWRNEEDLKRDCSTYAEKFRLVKDDLLDEVLNE